MEKSSSVYRRNYCKSRTLPWGTPDNTLANLLLQPSTTTFGDRLQRNCVSEQTARNLKLPQSRAWRGSKRHWNRSEQFKPPAPSPMYSVRCVPPTEMHQKCQDLSYKRTLLLEGYIDELTSSLQQSSTITCCDRFGRHYVNIDNTLPPIPTEYSLLRTSWWLTLSKAALKSICTILASCQLSNALCSVWDMHKSASQLPRYFQ